MQIQWSYTPFGLVFIISHVEDNYLSRDHCLFNWTFAGGIQTYGQCSESCCWNAEDLTDWMRCPIPAHWQEYLQVQADKRIINYTLKCQKHHAHSFFFFSFCVQVSLFFPKNAKMLAKEFAGSDSWITIHFGENYLPWQEVFNFPTVANTCSQSLNQLCV